MITSLRLVLAGAAFAAIFGMNPGSLRAAEGPWCALLNFGSDLTEYCQYRSLQDCLPAVTAGFRGFCNLNPRWQAMEPPQLRRKRTAHR
jgi:hypothetical protein